MSIADIIAIQGLLSDSDDLAIFERKQPLEFRDKSDSSAALAEINLLLQELCEKHDDDQFAVTDEFHAILEEDERLQAAVIKAVCRQLCEDPQIENLMAKRKRAGKVSK